MQKKEGLGRDEGVVKDVHSSFFFRAGMQV